MVVAVRIADTLRKARDRNDCGHNLEVTFCAVSLSVSFLRVGSLQRAAQALGTSPATAEVVRFERMALQRGTPWRTGVQSAGKVSAFALYFMVPLYFLMCRCV
jgi:hypothetical protein